MQFHKILIRNFFILIFVFFLFFDIALAIPPAIQVSGTTGFLQVVYPKQEYFLLNDSTVLHFHLFNSSAKQLNGTTATCFVHLYNSSNKHILETELVEEGVDFEIEIPTNALGHYSYNLWCNSTEGEFGFLSSDYYITNSGQKENIIAGSILTFIVALLPLVLALIFVIVAATLGEGHNILRWFLLLTSPFFIVSSLHSLLLGIIKFFNFPNLIDYIGDFTYWFGLVIVAFIIYFIIYFIAYMFSLLRDKKQKELEY